MSATPSSTPEPTPRSPLCASVAGEQSEMAPGGPGATNKAPAGAQRRERYAAAIQEKATGGIALNSILPEVYDAADAAMAVADEEQRELRAEREAARRWAVALENQLAAVRAECDALTAELYPVGDDGMAIAVARIRAILDDEGAAS